MSLFKNNHSTYKIFILKDLELSKSKASNAAMRERILTQIEAAKETLKQFEEKMKSN